MSTAEGARSPSPRHGVPGSLAGACCTHTRRSVWMASRSRNEAQSALGSEGFEQPTTIGSPPFCPFGALCLCFGQANSAEALLVAFCPRRVPVVKQPRGSNLRPDREGMMHRLPHALPPTKRTDRSLDRGGSRPLLASRLDPATCSAERHHPIEPAAFGSMGQQTAATSGEQGASNARIGPRQAQEILPIHARAHGVRCWSIGQPLRRGHQAHQRKPPGSFGWVTTDGKPLSTIFIPRRRASLLPQLHPHVPLRPNGSCSTDGLFGDRWDGLWMHGQSFSPR